MSDASKLVQTGEEFFESLYATQKESDPFSLGLIAENITIKGQNAEWDVTSLAVSNWSFVLIGERRVNKDN